MPTIAAFLLLLAVLGVSHGLPTATVVQTSQAGDRLTTKDSISFGPDFTSPLVLTINPETTYQTILGFGGAFTEAAASVWLSMNSTLQAAIIEAYFGKTGIHYTVGRVHMNSCDFSISSYSSDDTVNDYNLVNFNISHDHKYLIPMLTAAIKASSAPINLFLTPWSPPAWMKSNGQMNGSNHPGLIQNAQIFKAWALFFSKFITQYKDAGIPFWGLTVQNEPENAGGWESCVYTAEQERDFLKNYLGPQIKADHPDVKIMIFDHNKDHLPAWVSTIIGDPEAAQYIWGTGFHWYSGSQFQNVLQAHNLAPTKHLLGTEACNCPPRAGDWGRGESYGIDILGDIENWAEGWTDWNLVLNPQGGPNHLNNFCDAPIIADSARQTISFNIPYYYMGHFSKFLVPGSVRVHSTAPAGIQATAVRTPTNQIVVVILNTSNNDVTFKLLQGDGAIKVVSPKHSIISLSYENF